MKLAFWRKRQRARCVKCKSRLSEWFTAEQGRMSCYDCEYVNPWRTHEEFNQKNG